MNSDQLKLSNFNKKIVNNIENNYIKINVKIIDIVNFIEKSQTDEIKLAYPVNICINDCVLYYSPSYNDKYIINNYDIIKLHFGYHLNGLIISISRTYYLGSDEKIINMIKLNRSITESIINDIKVDSYIPDISRNIEEIIASKELYTFEELCSHQMSSYKIYDKLVIPNISCDQLLPDSMKRIKDNTYFAINQFLTDKKTSLYGNLDSISHYMFNYFHYNENNFNNLYKTLCFDIKWLNNTSILKMNYIRPFPPLYTVYKACIITNYEDTIYVNNNKNILLT
jgi:methionine aminopeptidase